MVEDHKKGQPKLNTLDQMKKDVSQKLKKSLNSVEIIRLRRPSRTHKNPSDLEDLQTSEAREGPRLHASFVVFYDCPHQRI